MAAGSLGGRAQAQPRGGMGAPVPAPALGSSCPLLSCCPRAQGSGNGAWGTRGEGRGPEARATCVTRRICCVSPRQGLPGAVAARSVRLGLAGAVGADRGGLQRPGPGAGVVSRDPMGPGAWHLGWGGAGRGGVGWGGGLSRPPWPASFCVSLSELSPDPVPSGGGRGGVAAGTGAPSRAGSAVRWCPGHSWPRAWGWRADGAWPDGSRLVGF